MSKSSLIKFGTKLVDKNESKLIVTKMRTRGDR